MSERYIPALGARVLTPLFDAFARLLMRDAVFRRRLIEQAHVGPHISNSHFGGEPLISSWVAMKANRVVQFG